MHLRQLLAALDSLRFIDQSQGLIHVARRLKLAPDQNRQLGELFSREESGGCGQTALQVRQRRFSDSTHGTFIVKRVVNELKRLPDVCAIEVARFSLLIIIVACAKREGKWVSRAENPSKTGTTEGPNTNNRSGHYKTHPTLQLLGTNAP